MRTNSTFEVNSVSKYGVTPVYNGPSLGAAIAAKQIALDNGAESATIFRNSAAIQTEKQSIKMPKIGRR